MATAELLGIGRVATTDRRDSGAVNLCIELEMLPSEAGTAAGASTPSAACHRPNGRTVVVTPSPTS